MLEEYSAALQELAKRTSPAVVKIRVQKVVPVKENTDDETAGFVTEQEATGSGVIVDPSGYIITNAHVVQSGRRISVQIVRTDEQSEDPHSHTFPAKLVGMDTVLDLAVIKIEGQNLPVLRFLNSDELRQGQIVAALGSPRGLQNSFTQGVISATSRQLRDESPLAYIQTDAPINPGNSGGPLIDLEGRIAGINTMILTESGGNEGLGFAIPANMVKDAYDKLRQDGKIRRGAIGVIPQTITPTLSAALGLGRDSGVILSDVAPRSAAEAGELEPGDVVLSVNGKPMHNARDLSLAIFQRVPGDQLTLEIQRGEEKTTKTVAIMERHSDPGQLADLVNYDTALVRRLGILAVTVDERVTPILPDLRHLTGVAVAAVPAEFAGLNPGLVSGDVIYAVNNHSVATLEELKAFIKGLKAGDAIAFFVERSGQLIYVTGTLE